MAEVAREFVLIDDRLRFVFFGLECALDVMLYPQETERVFRNCRDDQVSAKGYSFYESRRLRVLGQVDEYEHETLILQIEGHHDGERLLQRVIDGANILLRDLERDRETNIDAGDKNS